MFNGARRVLVPLAAGAEEMEATIIVDVLRRAGADVVVAGVHGAEVVRCSRGVNLVPDVALADVTGEFDAVVLPGGAGGAKALAESSLVGDWLKRCAAEGRLIGAICAAPTALARHGILLGVPVTAHPSVHAELASSYAVSTDRVVQHGTLITSQGPGTTFAFALRLVEALYDAEHAARVAAPMLI